MYPLRNLQILFHPTYSFSSLAPMIYTTEKPLLLASHSPRRKEFLDNLGIQFSVQAREIDETPLSNEQPMQYVERMAYDKARIVSLNYPDYYVLAADTAVCLGETILGKPEDKTDAVKMLLSLAGKSHVVYSGICVLSASENIKTISSVATEVVFIDFGESLAKAYVDENESLDKAGAYGIQGLGGFLVERISGSYSNVVGLPLTEVLHILVKHDVLHIP